MEPTFDVIVCGSLHLDIVVKAPSLPRLDETAVGQSWAQVCGGKGGNQAIQAQRAGAATAMIGRIGPDAFGETLRLNLVTHGVDARCVSTDPTMGSGMSVAIIQDTGDYGAVIVSGANMTLGSAALASDWRRLGGGRVAILQNEIPHAANVAFARTARDHGALVVFNAAPARRLDDRLLSLVDVLVVNRIEAEAMSGVAISDKQLAHQALKKLISASRSTIITLGGDGLVAAAATGKTFDVDPVPVRVTSTHGAGDCFVGTLCANLARGNSLEAACRAANLAAAAFVSAEA